MSGFFEKVMLYGIKEPVDTKSPINFLKFFVVQLLKGFGLGTIVFFALRLFIPAQTAISAGSFTMILFCLMSLVIFD